MLLAITLLCSSYSNAHSVDIALTLTEGTSVGENVYFSENNNELGLSTTAYLTNNVNSIIIGAQLTTSDKRESQQYKFGVLQKFAQNHQISMYLHTIDAEEKYFFKEPVIDGKHRQALTNTEWGVFAKLKYQYQIQHVGFGFLASTHINSTQLIQDEFSVILAYKKSAFFAEIIAGKEQKQLIIGINLSI